MRLHEILAFSDLSASSSNVSNSFRTPFPEKVTFSREKVTFSREKVTFTILKVIFRKLSLPLHSDLLALGRTFCSRTDSCFILTHEHFLSSRRVRRVLRRVALFFPHSHGVSEK